MVPGPVLNGTAAEPPPDPHRRPACSAPHEFVHGADDHPRSRSTNGVAKGDRSPVDIHPFLPRPSCAAECKATEAKASLISTKSSSASRLERFDYGAGRFIRQRGVRGPAVCADPRSAPQWGTAAGELVAHLGLSQPGVSKHLKVLREAGLVVVRAADKQRLYALRAGPLAEVDQWLEPYRLLWSSCLDNLERHLKENPCPTEPSKRSTVDSPCALNEPSPTRSSVRGGQPAAELECWFPAVAQWTPAVGEKLEAYGMTGEVIEVDPPRILKWLFNGDEYSLELAPDEEGCRLVFTHAFDEGTPTAQDGRATSRVLMPTSPAGTCPRRRRRSHGRSSRTLRPALPS
ncbi:regulatory protein, arsR family [Arthrobacter sp. VKM Ac-2550]|nr:regulatory protein, arsR family [Arthrobacter sp. VKM Ac-2550]